MNSLKSLHDNKKRKLDSESEPIKKSLCSSRNEAITEEDDNIIYEYQDIQEIEIQENEEDLQSTIQHLIKENEILKRENKILKENRELKILKLGEKCVVLRKDINLIKTVLDQALERISEICDEKDSLDTMNDENVEDKIYYTETQEDDIISNAYSDELEMDGRSVIDDNSNDEDILDETSEETKLCSNSAKQACSFCSSEISVKHMADHILIHKNQKTYRCVKTIFDRRTGTTRVCNKKFNTAGYLSKHHNLVVHNEN